MEDGSYQFPFFISKKNAETGGTLSMADRGWKINNTSFAGRVICIIPQTTKDVHGRKERRCIRLTKHCIGQELFAVAVKEEGVQAELLCGFDILRIIVGK